MIKELMHDPIFLSLKSEIATKEDNVININTYELPKSYVICEENGKMTVYVSPISSRTLNKRAETNSIKESLNF